MRKELCFLVITLAVAGILLERQRDRKLKSMVQMTWIK